MKKFQKLSETEMEVMEVIWALDHPVTSSELLTIFSESKGKDWKGQTIATFLARLVDKDLLLAKKQGRSNSYTPRLTPSEYKKWEAQSVLDVMYKGSVKNFLATLYDGEDMSKEDISDLKKWFSEK